MIDRIQIGPTVYSVVVDTALADAGNCWGRLDYPREAIYVDDRQAGIGRRITILHEVLHGCFHVTDNQHENEEAVVGSLTAVLLDTLRRNPELVAYLTGDDE